MKKYISVIIPVLVFILISAGCQTRIGQRADVFGFGTPEIAFLISEGFNDQETMLPMAYFVNKGFDVTIIGADTGMVSAGNSNFELRIEQAASDVSPGDFYALVVPGGQDAGQLSENPHIVAFATDFYETGKVVAAISEGQRLMETVGVHEGAEGVESVWRELEDIAEDYKDQGVFINRNLITSHGGDNLAEFSMAVERAIRSLDR
jgi:protease I